MDKQIKKIMICKHFGGDQTSIKYMHIEKPKTTHKIKPKFISTMAVDLLNTKGKKKPKPNNKVEERNRETNQENHRHKKRIL